MGIIIKKRFGPRNFVQQLGFKDVYTIGPKKKKTQQVGFDNPQEYIIPQNDISEFTKDMRNRATTQLRRVLVRRSLIIMVVPVTRGVLYTQQNHYHL